MSIIFMVKSYSNNHCPYQDDRTTEKHSYSDRIHAVFRIYVYSYDIDLIEEHRFINSSIVEYTYGPVRNNIA